MIKVCKDCKYSKVLEDKFQCKEKKSFYYGKLFSEKSHACDIFESK